jgi:hypothetical protein
MVARSEGDYVHAAEYFLESIRQAWLVSGSRGSVVARGLGHLARTRFLQGDIAQARQLFGEALAVMQTSHIAGYGLPDCLDWLAALVAADERPHAAAVLFGAAETQWHASGGLRYTPEQARYAEEVASVRGRMMPDEFAAAWREGQIMSRDEAIAYALELTPPSWK